MPNTIEKQSIPVFLGEDKEPIAIIYFSPTRERVIYLTKKADEDEIIALFDKTDIKIKPNQK